MAVHIPASMSWIKKPIGQLATGASVSMIRSIFTISKVVQAPLVTVHFRSSAAPAAIPYTVASCAVVSENVIVPLTADQSPVAGGVKGLACNT